MTKAKSKTLAVCLLGAVIFIIVMAAQSYGTIFWAVSASAVFVIGFLIGIG